MRTRILVSTAALVTAACSGAPPPERAAEESSAIINGTNSDASQDAVVLLFYPVGLDAFACTGTLLAPNLVLTARHCVSNLSHESNFSCDENGVGSAGADIGSDFTASNMYVVAGAKRPGDPTRTFAAKGAKIIHDSAKNLCNHDLALLLLDRPVPNAQILPIRLDAPIAKSETFTAIGWGVTTQTAEPSTRQQRTDIQIAAVGPTIDALTSLPVPSHEFMVGESICQGDSGGPALDSKTNAVLGVVSRGGNGTAENPTDPSASCVAGYNFYSATSGYKDMILDAYNQAGQDPWLEGGADPRLARFGEPCDNNDACRSSLCLGDKDGKGTTCTQSCDSTSPCPQGYTCSAISGAGSICKPKPAASNNASGGGGCAASGFGGGGASLGFAVTALALAMARARRRRT